MSRASRRVKLGGLPEEVSVQVLSHLDATSLNVARGVSSMWRDLSPWAAKIAVIRQESRRPDWVPVSPLLPRPCWLRALWASERLERFIGPDLRTGPDAWRQELLPLIQYQFDVEPIAMPADEYIAAQLGQTHYRECVEHMVERGWETHAAEAMTLLFNCARGAMGSKLRARREHVYGFAPMYHAPQAAAATHEVTHALHAAALRQYAAAETPPQYLYANLVGDWSLVEVDAAGWQRLLECLNPWRWATDGQRLESWPPSAHSTADAYDAELLDPDSALHNPANPRVTEQARRRPRWGWGSAKCAE